MTGDDSTIGYIREQNGWLDVRCSCGRSVNIPARLLSKRLIDDLPAKEAISHLRCHKCGNRPQSSQLWRLDMAPGYARAM